MSYNCTLYYELQFLLNNRHRHIYFRKETYVERVPGESANDRNDRSIRVACAWFNQHWKVDRKIFI